MKLENCKFREAVINQDKLNHLRTLKYKGFDDYLFLSHLLHGKVIKLEGYSHDKFYKKVKQTSDFFYWEDKNIFIIPATYGVFKASPRLLDDKIIT